MLEHRNKDLTNLHKGADYLSRSLRENLRVYSVDSIEKSVMFLSEKNTIISCNYEQNKDKLYFTNIVIESVEDYVSPEKMDNNINSTIDSFVVSLRKDQYDKVDVTFDDIISLFEDRAKIESNKEKIETLLDSFRGKTDIVDSESFLKLQEVKPMVVNFLKENSKEVLDNKDILNSVKICNAIHTAFETEKISYELLEESPYFNVPLGGNKHLYETICQQELVRQELIEAKESFSNIWMTNDKIQNLASLIYSTDEVVFESLSEVIKEIPYFAFSSKADINSILTSVYEVNSTDVISKKDIKEFTKKLFEAKKPVKKELVSILDEKYGINIHNLKFVPTFSNLAKTQSVFFEVLSLVNEDGGVLNDVLKEFSRFVSKKGGVDVLAVNDYIYDILESAKIDIIQENLLINYIDMPRLTRDLGALKTLLGGDDMDAGGGMGDEMGEEGIEGEEGVEPETEEEIPEEEMEGDIPPDEEVFDASDEEESENMEDEEGMEPEMGEAQPEEEGEAVGDDSVETHATGTPEKHQDAAKLVSDLEALVKGFGVRDDDEDEDEQYGI